MDQLHLAVVCKGQVGTSCLVQPVLDAYPKACRLWRWDCACLYFHLCPHQECLFRMGLPQTSPHVACYHIANHLGLHKLVSWRCALDAYGCPVLGTKPETVCSKKLADVWSYFWLLCEFKIRKIRLSDLPSGNSCSSHLTMQAAEVAWLR